MGVNRINFRDPQAQREGLGRRLVHALLLAVFLWLIGFMGFIGFIPREVRDGTTKTDAIVVLTGGGDRLAEGFRLLDAGLSPRMLITGVAQGVTLAQVIDGMSSDKSMLPSPENLACCVTLGYEAGNTVGNAVETATWVRDNKINSVRLVTANYHMKRSQLEFHRALPGITIIPHPVFPKEVQDNWWFVKPRILVLLGGEYHKFVGAWGRGLLQDGVTWLGGDHLQPDWWPDWAKFDWPDMHLPNLHLPDWKWPDWLPRPWSTNP
ncbi:YdcF family protein [Dongia rigui]|uniref:YdcF family protein n=1 Tax=Dongia rigui TaxID=940149 RepID=A0ABU5E1Z3_9PROT|nr:YdcF family protein [Dongia rigui]MDY0873508.1 YdcF family protein [Dongia rigui]